MMRHFLTVTILGGALAVTTAAAFASSGIHSQPATPTVSSGTERQAVDTSATSDEDMMMPVNRPGSNDNK